MFMIVWMVVGILILTVSIVLLGFATDDNQEIAEEVPPILVVAIFWPLILVMGVAAGILYFVVMGLAGIGRGLRHKYWQ